MDRQRQRLGLGMVPSVVMLRRIAILIISIVSVGSHGWAQSAEAAATQDPGTDPKPNWSVRASVATYVLPGEEDYVQPTVAVDHGTLHLEGRYNYEARRSGSGFVGWNVESERRSRSN